MRQQSLLELSGSFAIQADRDGRGEMLAEAYEKNLLSQQNEMLVVGEVASPEVPSSIILKELRTKKATSTGFFFALFTILKVSPPTSQFLQLQSISCL